jgi:hypothetical protein
MELSALAHLIESLSARASVQVKATSCEVWRLWRHLGDNPLVEESPEIEGIASVLFAGFVEDPQPWGEDKKSEFITSLWPMFQARWRLYREATVLGALISRAVNDDRYWDLTRALGKLIHGDPSTPEGAARIADLGTALKDIGSLHEPQHDQEEPHIRIYKWVLDWFEKIGELPHNPITCVEFGLRYFDFDILVQESLNKMEKEGIVP